MTTLTLRELEVAREVSTGKSDKAIGAALGITCITVRNHLANIRAKLGVSNRTLVALRYAELNRMAPRIGLTPAEARERESLRGRMGR